MNRDHAQPAGQKVPGTDYRCIGNRLAWNETNGQCGGTRVGSGDCNVLENAWMKSYICVEGGNTAECVLKPELIVELKLCQLTGSLNTYINCIQALPIEITRVKDAWQDRDDRPKYSPPRQYDAR